MAEGRDDEPPEGAEDAPAERSGLLIRALPKAEESCEEPVLGTADEETFEIDPGIDLEALPRGTTIGRFVLLGSMGTSPLGVVYAAFDPDRDGKVALRLLPVLDADIETTRQRLALVSVLRSVAKLVHPCIVSIHDVGTWAGGVYIAMEFFDGIDLRTWMEARDEPFPWREVIRTFREAGRGLAFAHQRGIMHGDFGPDRVLMGKQGQVRVNAFGMAETTAIESEEDAEALVELRRALGLPERDVTPDAFPGTPDYVAPEVLAGEHVDARSDQFSFCASLYEALYGERPYADGRIPALAAALGEGRVRPAPAGSNVPEWLRATVVRGLAPRRGDRWPSMELLLRALDRDPAASRRRWIRGSAALGLAAGLAGLVAYGAIHEQRECENIDQELAGVWDAERRDALEQAFVATGLPHASDTWRATADIVDDWVVDASAHRVEACMATRVRGEASDELYADRRACLDARMGELGALLDTFERIDGGSLSEAPRAAAWLDSVRSCTLPAVLLEVTPSRDADPDRVADVKERVDRGWALLHLGRAQPAAQLVGGLVGDARGLRHPGLETDVLRLSAAIDRANGRAASAEATLHEAARRASREQLDHALARTWLELAELLAADPARADEAGRWAAYAETLVERLPEERALRLQLVSVRGDIAATSDKPAEALGFYHDALALLERRDAPVLERAAILDRLAALVAARGEHDAAQDYALRAVDQVRGGLGPNHPALAHALIRLADVQAASERLEDANANWNRALTILGRAHGPVSREVAVALVDIAAQLRAQGQYSAALDHDRRAAAMLDVASNRDGELLARALFGQGRSLLALGRPTQAREPLDRAVALWEAAHRAAAHDDPARRKAIALAWADAQAELARVLWADSGDRERARVLARGARSLHLEHGGDRSAVADLEIVLATPELR